MRQDDWSILERIAVFCKFNFQFQNFGWLSILSFQVRVNYFALQLRYFISIYINIVRLKLHECSLVWRKHISVRSKCAIFDWNSWKCQYEMNHYLMLLYTFTNYILLTGILKMTSTSFCDDPDKLLNEWLGELDNLIGVSLIYNLTVS